MTSRRRVGEDEGDVAAAGDWAADERADVQPLCDGGNTLRLLTYNFLIRPPPITYNGNDYKDERIDALVNTHLRNYDIVCLQEVFGLLSFRRQRIINEAARVAGLKYSIHSPSAFPALTDGGCVILSRFPIVASDSVKFGCGMNADMLASKGCLYARIQVRPDVCMHVFTTHLQADYKKNIGRQRGGNLPNERMRRAQLRTLATFIKNKVDPFLVEHGDWPIVLLGDLNINSRRAPTDSADSDEYLAALRVLSHAGFQCRDLLAESHSGSHPVTICDSIELPDGTLQSTEPQLTPHNEFHWRRSIDYVMLLHRDSSLENGTADDDDMVPPCCCCGLFSRQPYDYSKKKDDDDTVGTPSTKEDHDDDEKKGLVSSTASSDEKEQIVSQSPIVHPVPGIKHTVVEPFDANRPDRPYNHLSDHYGVRSLWTF